MMSASVFSMMIVIIIEGGKCSVLCGGAIGACIVVLQNERLEDIRCKCELARAALSKRTFRVVIQFFRCSNAANGGYEPIP
jgi:hypothetical protein